jgi:hypothetical protein
MSSLSAAYMYRRQADWLSDLQVCFRGRGAGVTLQSIHEMPRPQRILLRATRSWSARGYLYRSMVVWTVLGECLTFLIFFFFLTQYSCKKNQFDSHPS